MKKKSRHAPLRRKHEFRFFPVEFLNKNGKPIKFKHPAYIFLEKGNIFIYVTLTHSSYIENYLVIKLRKNPNRADKKDSYWIVDFKESTKDKFGRRLNNWIIDVDDDKEIIERYKKSKE